jgi:hypothetical protein
MLVSPFFLLNFLKELTMNLPDPTSWSNQGVHTTCISDFLGYPPQLLISSLQSGRKKPILVS